MRIQLSVVAGCFLTQKICFHAKVNVSTDKNDPEIERSSAFGKAFIQTHVNCSLVWPKQSIDVWPKLQVLAGTFLR